MTRRQLLAAATAAPIAPSLAASPSKVLKNMGSATPGLGARVRAVRDAGQEFDIVEYCHEKGLGAPHMYLRGEFTPERQQKLRRQLDQYDMRMTVAVRTPRTDADLPQYEATVRALSEMDGRIACIHDPFSGRRYEQFQTASEFHEFDAMCKAAVHRALPVLHRYKMPLAIENHKGWRSRELVDWINETGSEFVGICLDLVNNVSLIETPMQTIETLAPYTLFVSFKDVAADFYDEGILLSEVPFGEGHNDLPAIVAMLQKQDPGMIFQLEMITRDPLKVPIFTDAYWKVFDDKSPVPPRDLAMLVEWIREHPPKHSLPRVSGLSSSERLRLEDDYNQRCIEYARQHLPL